MGKSLKGIQLLCLREEEHLNAKMGIGKAEIYTKKTFMVILIAWNNYNIWEKND